MPQSMEEHRRQVKEYYTRSEPDQIFDHDQYTCSEHYAPYYGYLIADRLAEIVERHKAFQIYEVGGGRGQLAYDILTRLRKNHKRLYSKISYTIIDISHKLSLHQNKRLHDFNSAAFINASATHLPFFDGALGNAIILCNEVLADLPSAHVSKNEKLSIPVKDLIDRVGINIDKGSYFNMGAFQFLLEVRRILTSGALLIIEYGVENDPRPRVLGTDDFNHVEVAIDIVKLKAAAESLFPDVISGPLIDLVGEKNLECITHQAPEDMPGYAVRWLFDLIWMTEHLEGMRLDSEIIEKYFKESDNNGPQFFERVKYWIETAAGIDETNQYQKIFLKNLTGLMAPFEQRFGREATRELFSSLKRLHQLNTEISFDSTLRANRGYLRKGELDEDFFFLLCEL